MGTHPIFESDFDCLTDHRPRNKMSHPANPGYHQVLQPVNAPPSQVVSSVGGGQPGQPGQQSVRFASQTYRGAPQRIIVQHSGRPRYMPPGGGGGGGHAGRGGPVRPVYPGGGGGHNKGPDGGGGAAGERGGVIDQQDLKLISKLNLNKLARDVDPNAILEDEVIDFLLKLSEDFIDTVVTGSCALAKHRKSPTLDTADIKLCLSRQFDLQIPGFPIEDLQLKKQQTGEAHKQRLQLIRKQMKR